jgi:hypothetical protein
MTSRPCFYVDESLRRGTYFLAAVAVSDPRHSSAVTTALRRLPPPGTRRLHAAKERDEVRLRALTVLADLPVRALVVEGHGRPAVARERCIELLLQLMAKEDAGDLVLERQDGQEARDRRCIARCLSRGIGPVDLGYRHEDPYGQPMLWAADMVAWAAGADRPAWRPLVSRILDRT